jgi:predicted nucleic acid-binding protein
MIIDSNLIIYASRPEYPGLRRLIAYRVPAVSAVSKIEVLGYHKLFENDRHYFERFFEACHILPITDAVIARAIVLRQSRKMSLGDALIAATALESERELHTHNIKDYEGIHGLVAIDPIASGDPL